MVNAAHKAKIHYHTDCPYFAGCESMLVNFCSSAIMRRQFTISLSYRDSLLYTQGMHARMKVDFLLYPMPFPDPSSVLPAPAAPRSLRRIVRLLSRVLFTAPLLLYEVARLVRLFRQISPSLVHINNGGYPAALSARAAALAAYLAGVPSVMIVNNLATGYDHPTRWFGYALDRFVARAVDCFVTGSTAAAAQLRRVLRLSSNRCRSIHNGVSMRSPSETIEQTRKRLRLEGFGGLVFAVIAVLEPRKGHGVLLDALLKVRASQAEALCDIKVLIEGEGPLLEDLLQRIRQAELENHCVLIGREPNIANLFGVIDVLIAPSVGYEDFPTVILEAMGAGKAVIASRLAGAAEQVVDGETGILVTPGSSEELARAICQLCQNRNLPGEMGRSGLKRFESRFTADIAVGRYVELYRSLLEAQ